MDFSTTQHKDFQWPFPKPIVGRPCEPPSPSQIPPPRPPPVAPYCHCDAHTYSPRVEQYKQLLEKERKLCEDYENLRKTMVDVTNDILDHPCDDNDSKMVTMYQATYKKRSFPLTDYREIVAASQSTAPVPMEANRLGILLCYKDPTSFNVKPPTVRPTIHPPAAFQSLAPIPMEVNRLGILLCYKDPTSFTAKPPTVRPTIQPPGKVHTGVTPKSISMYYSDFPGRTEYQDTYSAAAKANWSSMQRYKEPMPSTRRRADDNCL